MGPWFNGPNWLQHYDYNEIHSMRHASISAATTVSQQYTTNYYMHAQEDDTMMQRMSANSARS